MADRAPAYMPKAQQTPWQQSSEIDLAHTAVLVIDVLGGDTGIPEAFEKPIRNCLAIVEAAHKAGLPVIFSDDNHVPAYDRELELWGEHGIKGTQGSLPLEDFDRLPTDIVIPKRRYDGFFQTDLDLTLRELGVTTLIAVGADANICVLQTLAGAYFRNYKTIVPADAVWTFLIGTQEGALAYYTRCYDSRVVTTRTVLEEYLRA